MRAAFKNAAMGRVSYEQAAQKSLVHYVVVRSLEEYQNELTAPAGQDITGC